MTMTSGEATDATSFHSKTKCVEIQWVPVTVQSKQPAAELAGQSAYLLDHSKTPSCSAWLTFSLSSVTRSLQLGCRLLECNLHGFNESCI